MLSKNQEKLIKALQTKKGREKNGLCLVEGEKVIEVAHNYIDFTFTSSDTEQFTELITTETPQDIAAIARIPEYTLDDLQEMPFIVVTNGVQDPGNLGAILRLCLAYKAGLLLVDSVDPTSPKVVRSSVGALFQVPWVKLKREEAVATCNSLQRAIIRLEKRPNAEALTEIEKTSDLLIVVGSEGNGIQLPVEGQSVMVEQEEALESLNVANATAIALHHFYTN